MKKKNIVHTLSSVLLGLKISNIVQRIVLLLSRVEHVQCFRAHERILAAESHEIIQYLRGRLTRARHQIDAGAGEESRPEHDRHPLVRLIGRRCLVDEDEAEVARDELESAVASPLETAGFVCQLRVDTFDVGLHEADERSSSVVLDQIVHLNTTQRRFVESVGDRRRQFALPHVQIRGENVPEAERTLRIEFIDAHDVDVP